MPTFDERFSREPRGLYKCRDALVVAPISVREVSGIVALCNKERIPVIPFGGGTGLVGGQVAPDLERPLVLSLQCLRAVRSINAARDRMTVDAGLTLQEASIAAADAGRLFPLSIASKGSSQIGGIMATNAGGVHVVRYGNARDLCKGIEAVLPDGSVVSCLDELPKDNSGYDLRNLIIGSEGTLAIITAATLKLFRPPGESATALLALNGIEAAHGLLALFMDAFPDQVSAFELINRIGFEFLVETGLRQRLPFGNSSEWLVMVDIGALQKSDVEKHVIKVAEAAEDEALIVDGILAQSEGQREELWAMRELIPSAHIRIGAVASHDISLPAEAIVPFVNSAAQRIAAIGPFRVNCFGHFGDGNLHYNVFPPAGGESREFRHCRTPIVDAIHGLVRGYGGSIAAEHGCGRLKAAELQLHGNSARLAAMRAIKDAIDPHGIMNPGAVFPLA